MIRRPPLALASSLLLAGVVLAFVVGPVALLVARSLLVAPAEMLAELGEPATRLALWNTLATALGAAALSFGLGAPLALLLYRTDLPARGALAGLLALPSAVPPFIQAMGWIALANPKTGLLNQLVGMPVFNAYSGPGIAWVNGIAGLPLVVFAGRAALARIDPSLEEAARLSGAGPLRTLLHVTIPLALPALLSGAALVCVVTAASFGVPYLLGTSASPPTSVLTTRIYGLVLVGGESALARAIGLSTLLLALATLVLGLNQRLGASGRVRLASGKGVSSRPLRLGAWRPLAGALAAAIVSALVLLPLLAVLLASLQATPGAPLLPESLTLSHWAEVLSRPRTRQAFATSLLLAAATAALVCAAGLAISVLRRRGGALGRILETVSSWPYAVPGTVLAMALLVAFSRDLRLILFDRWALVLSLADSLWLLLLAYASKELAVGTRTTSEGLAQLDPSLMEAARVSGAAPLRAFVDATLPPLRPALAATFLLVFLGTVSELTMSVLLLPPGAELVGTLLFELQSYADPAAAAVVACAFVGVVLASLVALSFLRRPVAGGR
jgi:iron(III) transport system permease protein